MRTFSFLYNNTFFSIYMLLVAAHRQTQIRDKPSVSLNQWESRIGWNLPITNTETDTTPTPELKLNAAYKISVYVSEELRHESKN